MFFVSPAEYFHTFHTQGREGDRGVFIITKVGVVAPAEVFTPRPSITFSSSILVFITRINITPPPESGEEIRDRQEISTPSLPLSRVGGSNHNALRIGDLISHNTA